MIYEKQIKMAKYGKIRFLPVSCTKLWILKETPGYTLN